WHPASPLDRNYQCIAWAACDVTRKWWPVDAPPECYWPPGVPFDDSVECFVQAFATLGYHACSSSDFQFGYQKVAIYANSLRQVKHMARQELFGGGWLSKMGEAEDIFHRHLRDIQGSTSPLALSSYGEVVQILRRNWLVAAIVVLRQRVR